MASGNSNTFPQFPNRPSRYSPTQPVNTEIVSRGTVSHPVKPPRARYSPQGPGLTVKQGGVFVS